MIETRVRDIRKMLPPSWAAEVVDGVIVVTSPELLDEADAVTIAQQLIREIEQPLTLSYTLSLPNAKALASATETAESYGLKLLPLDGDKYVVALASDSQPKWLETMTDSEVVRSDGKPAKRKRQPKREIEQLQSDITFLEPDDTGVTG